MRLNKNSGNPSRPRNKGLSFSHGKYIYFMDADDLLTTNTLETLYNYAEKYQVDVVSMNTYLEFAINSYEPFPKILYKRRGYSFKTPMPILKVEMESEDTATRIENFYKGKFWVTCWTKFLKRDFLIEKEIFFPDIRYGEDECWTLHLILEAKKILCIPETFYVYRILPKSHSHLAHDVNFYIESFIDAVNAFYNLRNKNKFFSDNPSIFYKSANNHFIERFLNPLCENFFIRLNAHEVFQTALKEFSARLKPTDNIAEICASFCTKLYENQKQIDEQKRMLQVAFQRISELEKSPPKN